MTRKRPWNRTNHPVYSISSKDEAGNDNMNIITYVTAVSMQPKRFICGIYENTKTLTNITSQQRFILQLLSASQYNLILLLGRRSGFNTDKTGLLSKRNLLSKYKDFTVLSNSLAVMEMKVINEMQGGDHTIYLCEVSNHKNLNDGEPLTLDILRRKNFIRI